MKSHPELVAKIDNLRRLVDAAKLELRQAQLKDIKEQLGIGLGTVIKLKSGALVTVVKIDPRTTYAPNLSGVYQKRNGEFGSQIRHIYEKWELFNEEEAA